MPSAAITEMLGILTERFALPILGFLLRHANKSTNSLVLVRPRWSVPADSSLVGSSTWQLIVDHF